MPEADEEAGQDKLRSAVEWGVFQRCGKPDGKAGTLLNLKPSLGDGFFARGGSVPKITAFPGGADPYPWIKNVPSEAYDEVYGLDFLQLQPDMEKVIEETSRILKPGGILFLNFFSREHFRLADSLAGPDGETPLQEKSAIPATVFSPEQVAEVSGRQGLVTRHIIPYSSFYGNSLWVDLLKSRFSWEWFLDSMSTDRKLFDLALFLEDGLVAKLGSIAAPRFIMVLEKSGPGAANPSALEAEAMMRTMFSSQVSPSGLAERMGVPLAHVRERLEAHLIEIRNRVFFQRLWNLLRDRIRDGDGLEWSGILPDRVREEFHTWQAQERMDSRCMQAARGWQGIPALAVKLRHRGVPMGAGLEYEQVQALLKSEFGGLAKGESR